MANKEEPKPAELTGPEKAAIFLLTLGEEFTTDIFKELEDYEIKELGKAMSRIQNVSSEQVQDVLWEFVAALQLPADLHFKGGDFFKHSLGRALNGERA